ncbi:MAG: ABC transporter substrate-binding protein [Bdellovibrionales bacterium]|nr:ABC transporter substrate-binding protein [Bdellovibrionales bacterium]
MGPLIKVPATFLRLHCIIFLFFIGNLILLISLLGCTKPEKASPSDALRVGIHDTIDQMNVFTQSSTDFWKIQNLLFEPLLRRDPITADLKPNLTKSYSWSEDKTAITFELKKGLQWSDGEPLTSDDVLFTFRAHDNPLYKSLYIGVFSELVEDLTVKSSTVFTVKFKRALYSNLSNLGLNLFIYPKHNYKNGKALSLSVNSGPYKIKNFQAGNFLEIKTNPYWHGRSDPELQEKYLIPSINFLSAASERSLFDLLQSHKIDFFQSLSPKSYLEFAKEYSENTTWKPVCGENYRLTGMRLVSLNHTRPGLNELAVRQAMMLGFDRQTVNKKFFNEQLEIAKGPWSEKHPYADAEKVGVNLFDPVKANRLLESHGWMVNSKTGIREKSVKGHREILSFHFLDYNTENKPLLTLFKESMKKIGIEINIQLRGFSEAMRRLKERQFDLAFHQAQWNVLEPNLRFWYFSKTNGNSYMNIGGYKDTKLDQIILDIEKSFDSRERKQLYQKAYVRIAEQLPELFWFHDKALCYFVSKKIHRPQDSLPYDLGLSTWTF